MRQALDFARTTAIGGAMFLLPIFVVAVVLGKVFGLMGGLTEPLVTALGVTSLGGIAVGNLITILARGELPTEDVMQLAAPRGRPAATGRRRGLPPPSRSRAPRHG